MSREVKRSRGGLNSRRTRAVWNRATPYRGIKGAIMVLATCVGVLFLIALAYQAVTGK